MALPNEPRTSFSSRRGGRVGGGSRRNDYMHQGDRRGRGPPGGKGPERRTDEDVLIAFMQLVRQGNVAAQEAQANYQQYNDQIQFLATARLLLDGKGPAPPSVRSFPSSPSSSQVQQQQSLPPQREEQQQKGRAKSHSSAVAVESQQGPSNGSMSTTTAEIDPVSALFANATMGKTSPFTTHAVTSSIERASVMQPPGMVKQHHYPREAATDSSVAEQAALAALPVEGTGKNHLANGSHPLASSFSFSLNPPPSSTTEAPPQGGEPSLNLTSRLAELFAPSKGGASPFSIGIGQTATSAGHVKGGLSVDVMAATNGDSKNGGNAFGPIRSPTSAITPTTPKTPQQQQQQQQLQQQQLRNDQHQQENGLQHQHQEGGGEGNQNHHQQQNGSPFGPGHPFHLQQQQQPPPPHHPMMLPPMDGGLFPPGYGHHPHHPHHPPRPPFFQGPMGGFPPGLFMHGPPPPGLEGPPPACPQQQGQVPADGRQEGPGGGGGDHHQSSPRAPPSQPSPHGLPQQQPPPSDPQHQQQQSCRQPPQQQQQQQQQPPFHPGGGPGVGGYPPFLGGPGPPPSSQGGHHHSNPFPPPFFGGFPPPHLQMFGWMGMGPPPGMGGMGGLPPPGLHPQQGTLPMTWQQQQQQHHVVGQEGQQAGDGGGRGGGGGQQLLPPPQQQQEDRPPHSHEGLLRSPGQGLTFTSNGGAADVSGVLQFLSGETASNGSLLSPPPKPAVVEAVLVEEGAVGSIPLPSEIADGGEVAAAAEGGGADAIVIATGEGDDVKRPKRTTRNQVGKLWVMDPHSGQYVTVIRPKTNLYVQWEAPAALLRGMIQPEVGLFRLGVSSNQNAVISKPMSLFPPMAAEEGEGKEGEGAALLRGSLSFYAPRSAGTFVFRMYDAEDHIATHGTSRQFVVEVQGRDVDSNLRVIQSQFKEKKTVVAALSQLSLLLRALKPFQPSRSFAALIWSAISSAVKQLAGGSGKDENGRSRYPVQSGIANVIYAALNNRLVMSVLASQQRTFLRAAEGLWCPFNEEFYPSEAARREYYLTNWGFDPLNLPLSVIPPQVPMLLSNEMEALLPSVLPSEAFLPRREDVRTRLEAMIGSMSCFPQGTKLRVFGSSANNFGNDEADLDMCVTFPSSGSNLPTNMSSSSEMIATLAEHLEAHGMAEVMPRPTARIPILLFKDPETGLDCDISVENPLALRNTQLLKVYSGVDPRVRALAYVVKHWARKRKINNASAGTLSSYAYILLVLHFLQTRRPSPIIPNLQLLPPDWEGQEVVDPMRLRSYLPPVMVQHPIDKVEVDTYFYTPPQADFRGLNQYAARNKASVGALLIEFFHYYAWEFDYREHVVSVRTGGVVKKDEKAEEDCWPVNQRMAVQDPFETWYNVTHFLKEGRHRHIRTEFARAYTLCVEEAAKVAKGQGGQAVGEGGSDLLKRICEEAPDAVVRKSMMGDEEAMLAAAVAGEGERGGEGLLAEEA